MNAWFVRIALVLGLSSGLILPLKGQGAPSSMDDATAVNSSIAYLQSQASAWGILHASEEFRLRQVVRDSLGQTHVRFDQVHQGILVLGQQLIVHFDERGAPQSITGAYIPGITVATQPGISGQEARSTARQRFPGALSKTPDADLVLLPKDDTIRLTYRVVLTDEETPRQIVTFIDAVTGDLVHSYNDLHTLLPTPAPTPTRSPIVGPAFPERTPTPPPTVATTGTGNSLYSGAVNITTEQNGATYSLVENSRGGLRTSDMNNRLLAPGPGIIFTDTDNTWGDGTTADRASAGVDAHFGAEVTWDYFLSAHSRSGIYDDGVGTLSRVHYRKRYNNAFWSDGCQCMTYGDGDGVRFTPLISLDVAGHEMTHGVTSATAALIYENQSGGLNEAMSDIYGTMVEYFAAALGVAKTPNYWIGEDVYTPGTPGDALRYMDDPTQDGRSIDTYADYADGIDVHLSSGIANNAFYLLAEGGTHRLGGVVTGIGRSAAERIFYRALTVYMIPSETFAQARTHTVQAASDLFGAGSQQVISVGQAWSAVGVP